MDDHETERREIAEGTIIKINGIPLRVCEPFRAETHPNNWAIVLAPLERDGLVNSARGDGNA